MYIRKTKKKAPASTKINKLILKNCTDKTLEQLKNACLSVGYFLNGFKELHLLSSFLKKIKPSPIP